MGVVLRDIVKRYDDGTLAIAGVDLEIADGEFFTLLGPSGCGKSSLLRVVAGLERPTRGAISIKGRDVSGVDPGDRDIAMVFQSYALYPHMTVLDNLGLNLRARGMKKEAARERARETARLLGLDELLSKKPGSLSGGQRQRVALGRAIVREPALFLMDEPLSNLDLKLREQMRTELKRLHERLGITTIYVTHDQSEALTLSDRLALLSAGEVQQVGKPIDVYDRPANLFVAEFVGSPSMNLLRGAVAGGVVTVAGSRIGAWPMGDRGLVVGIRPEDVVLVPPGQGVVDATVDLVEPNGSVTYVLLDVSADVLAGSREQLIVAVDAHWPVQKGTRVGIGCRNGRWLYFDPETSLRVEDDGLALDANNHGGGAHHSYPQVLAGEGDN